MRIPSWLRDSRAVEAASFTLICLLFAVGFSRGWHSIFTSSDQETSEQLSGDPIDAAGNSIQLSRQAQRTLGLRMGKAELGSFVRHISVPAKIVGWPGRTHVEISAPLTGTVISVHVAAGETIRSGDPLYTLRLTHQDLVKTQTEFLRALGKLDVVNTEVDRIEQLAQTGAIARKTLLEREYEQKNLQAEIRAQREALLLHGLSESQISKIETDRALVRQVTISAPVLHSDQSLHDDAIKHDHGSDPDPSLPPSTEFSSTPASHENEPPKHVHVDVDVEFTVTELMALRGQSVETGAPLTMLANYEFLYVEGLAFQQDSETIMRALKNEWPVQAVFESENREIQLVEDLRIAFLGGEVDPTSRALRFYVPLDNEVVNRAEQSERKYTSWRYRPGQRLRLRVPVEQIDNVFVVPAAAVVKEGAENYIFVRDFTRFVRRSVRIVLRDQSSVAIANDGSIEAGDTIAMNAAHQLQLALKNQAGGPVDAHAGHNH